ncbi:hypothetical protein Tco_0974671 [Tanacetum coccineum]|uniref:Uncharacterized protein n=1 Tax=Tanacetum coccineum TaxID=301880 RepID=A0ABQ5EC73_9ASTR
MSNIMAESSLVYSVTSGHICLVEMPMGGRYFTWMNKVGTKLSKLDQFLISENFLEASSDLKGTYVLFGDLNEVRDECERYVSQFDTSEAQTFNSFIDESGLVEMPIGSDQGAQLHAKLKFLKQRIKEWHKDLRQRDTTRKQVAQRMMNEIDLRIDCVEATEADKEERI